MKKFNLKEALAGKPVVTRSGRKVVDLHCFKAVQVTYPLFFQLRDGNSIFTAKENGSYCNSESKLDLFMAAEQKTGYANLYKDGELGLLCSSRAKVNKARDITRNLTAVVTIKWEE